MSGESTRENLVGWMAARKGRFRYANQKPGKLDPDSTGYSDCSGTIYAAYKAAANTVIGTMSYEQAATGQEIASGATAAEFKVALSKMLPGDVIAMDLSYSAYTGRVNHVEMYSGVGSMSWGHGGPGYGPTYHDLLVSWLIPSAKTWTVRRFIPVTSDETTTTATLSDLEEVIDSMKATHIIFEYGGGLWIANILAGTYSLVPNTKTFKSRVRALKKAGAKVAEWKDVGGSSNKVQNPAAFGKEVK
jgi:hypothetical protein